MLPDTLATLYWIVIFFGTMSSMAGIAQEKVDRALVVFGVILLLSAPVIVYLREVKLCL